MSCSKSNEQSRPVKFFLIIPRALNFLLWYAVRCQMTSTTQNSLYPPIHQDISLPERHVTLVNQIILNKTFNDFMCNRTVYYIYRKMII